MIKNILLLCGCFLGVTMPAKLYAADIRVAFGMSIPPYVVADENQGIEYDVIKEALAYKGHVLKPIYMPFVEVKDVFAEGRAEAIATLKKTVGVEGYYSDTVITYQNYAISLEENHLSIEKVSDLADKRIIAFQLAKQYLGAEFADMANNNHNYREKSEQEKQAKLLFKNKVDAIISDKNIFKFFSKKIIDDTDITKPVIYHDIFPPNHYSVAFKDIAVRDDFNAGLKHLHDSSRYQQIIDSYTN